MDWQTALIIYIAGFIATLTQEINDTSDYDWNRYPKRIVIMACLAISFLWPVYIPVRAVIGGIK